jgi:16S rRNA U1498 N3-methylase RsmE
MNFFTDEDLALNSNWKVQDEQFHHFKNVYRGKEQSKVKVFNGKGIIYYGTVSNIEKKSLGILIEREEAVSKKEGVKLILGVPKKEYLESIIKSSIQVGISKIVLINTKLIRSSITQSENPWMLEIIELKGLSDVDSLEGQKWVFTTEMSDVNDELPGVMPDYIFVGPEGGFHQDELVEMGKIKNVSFVRCPTPIMKAEIAVPYCAGFVSSLAPSVNQR